MAVSVQRGTTFDSRAFAPYLKSAIPAQSGLLGSTVSLSAAFYIAGGNSPVWTQTGLTALGLSINSSTGLITGTLSGATGNFTITCTNAAGSYTSASTQWAVTGTLSWFQSLPSPLNVPQGGFFDLAPYITGAPINITDSVALPSGISISMTPTPRLVATAGATGQTTNNIFTLVGSALADWAARSTAAGVIWSQRFKSRKDVDMCLGDGSQAQKQASSAFIRFQAADGIIGDGCMEQFYPQGGLPRAGWNRPLWPLINKPPDTDGVTVDINNAGLTPIDASLFGTTVNPGDGVTFPTAIWPGMVNLHQSGGAHFVNPAYSALSAGSYPWSSQSPMRMYGGDFWIQMRVKFSASRFNSAEASGKWMMLQAFGGNVLQEIVNTARTEYGGGWQHMYTSVGSNFNSKLWNPQNDPGLGTHMQPGGAKDPLTGDAQIGLPPIGLEHAWCFQPDTWITFMIRIHPGHQPPDKTASGWYTNPANDIARDTRIQILAALPGATSWTTVMDYSSFLIWFETDQPFGWGNFNLTPFNGGGASVPVVSSTGYFHRFDQIICSTQAIALPAI